MSLTSARQVADAVLYEGYLLYPYRASSAKNQVRWQFGVLGPEGAAAQGIGEPPALSCEVVLEAGAHVDVWLRFLQVQHRDVQRRVGDGWQGVDELRVGSTRWIPFHEAVPREVHLAGVRLDEAQTLAVAAEAGEDTEELYDGAVLLGRLVRTRSALLGQVTITPRPGSDLRLKVLRIAVSNQTPLDGATTRDDAAVHSFVGTHLLLTAEGGRFLSLLDGPDWADPDTQDRTQERCWPVLIHADDGSDAVLVAPIVLGDHPAIAPESAGDLFDATEIDEILTLRILTLTEEERAEARGTDPRAAAILARCDALDDEALQRLHGARRPPVVPPAWDPDEDLRARPDSDIVLVAGVPVSKGSRVMLRPTRSADAQDLFLAGLSAEVARVYRDAEGLEHIAVVLEDDPGRDLYDTTGRFYYFGPEELVPL
jgi:hypothetical protein